MAGTVTFKRVAPLSYKIYDSRVFTPLGWLTSEPGDTQAGYGRLWVLEIGDTREARWSSFENMKALATEQVNIALAGLGK